MVTKCRVGPWLHLVSEGSRVTCISEESFCLSKEKKAQYLGAEGRSSWVWDIFTSPIFGNMSLSFADFFHCLLNILVESRIKFIPLNK